MAGATFVDQAGDQFERRPVAQTFSTPGGARVTVVANHFKSKGSCPASGPDADQGNGQGCFNARRSAQATELARWLRDEVVPAAGDPDVLIVGDLNSYAGEDPIAVLENAGYLNLVKAFGGGDAYSFVFDGQWGYLDYALASASLRAQVTGTAEAHHNADEPTVLDYNTNFKSAGQIASLYAPDRFRTSDHDPVLVGLNLAPPTVAVAAGGSCDINGTTATSTLALTDPDTDPAALTLTATSSDQALLPNAGLTTAGSGATRTLTAATNPARSGRATVTVTVSDGVATATTTLTVIADNNGNNPLLRGTAGPDVILGKSGNDIITAAGIDLVCGGTGNDALTGGDGADTLEGQAGIDALFGGPGNDTLRGGADRDVLTGGPGADAYSGGPGNDTNIGFNPAEGDTTDNT